LLAESVWPNASGQAKGLATFSKKDSVPKNQLDTKVTSASFTLVGVV